MVKDEVLRTLADIPRFHAERRPDQVALIFGDRKTTYEELNANASRIANGLIAEGIRPGARVAVIGKDSDWSYELLFGCAKAGAVMMGVNWKLAAPEIAYILGDAGAEILFVGPDAWPKIEKIRGELQHIKTIIALSGKHPEWPPLEVWLAAYGERDPRRPADSRDVVLQLYTSGTTGHPKGVELANYSFFDLLQGMARQGDPWIGLGPSDVTILTLPTFHIGGIWWAIQSLAAGATAIAVESFVGWQILDLIQRRRVTKFCMVPAMIQVVLAEPACKQTDFSSLTHIIYGGSPAPQALIREALTTSRAKLAQIYGMTETGNMAVCLRPEEHDPHGNERMRSAGKALPGVELKVIDAEGRPLGPRAVGEICIRTPSRMIGYWNLPEATAKTLIDGWVRTGDAGYLDEDGFVYIQDRVKDMIIYAGENIYPAEVENAIHEHPAVAAAAVIGVPDDRWGESIKAFVVLKPGAAATAEQILAHTRERIADFKTPKSVEFVDDLPRTPSGKIKKSELRAPYWRGRERMVN